MSALKAIHVARRQLGLEDDDYRAILERVTDKSSSKLLNIGESGRVLDEMRRLGFQAPVRRRALTGPYAGKLTALWLSAYNLGITRSNTDKSLIAFVERQTGIAHLNWLRDAHQAAQAIEGVKKWIAREAGVVWPVYRPPRESKLAVLNAQCAKLNLDAKATIGGSMNLDATIGELGERIRGLAA